MQSSKHSKSRSDKTSVWLVLHGLALLFILVLFGIDVYIDKNPPTRVLMRTLIVVLAIIYSFFRILRHQASRFAAVEKLYANKIEDAFKSNKSGKKLLLSALMDYYNHQLSDCINKLNRLKEKAATPQEQRVICYFLALSFKGMGNTDEAIKLYNEILEKTPSYAPALSNLSVIYIEQKNYSLAIDYAQKALKNDPTNPFAYHNLAGAYFYTNDFEKARKYASTALELKKDLRSAATLLAIIDTICGSKTQAGQSFDLAVALGEKPDVLNEAIKTYEEQYHRHAMLEACLFDWKNKTSIPSIHFTLDGTPKKSIIGGQINEPAPLDSKGQKMRLLAAIFCSELPLNHIFPKCGVLRFYISVNESLGADFDALNDQKDFRVLFDDTESGFLTSAIFNAPNDDLFPVYGCYSPNFIMADDAMTPWDFRFESTAAYIKNSCESFQKAEGIYEKEAFTERLYEHKQGHKLGGYPVFTQWDPRENSSVYARYDTLLLQIESDYSNKGTKIMFGDSGVCNFFISGEKLKQQDFSDILYTWDCY